MTKDALRLGIVGIGQYAVTNHVPNFMATGRAQLVAASRRNPERLALAQRELGIPEVYTDWREMLDKAHLDAVVVSTPHDAHVEPTVAALERGLHVLLEKPVATTTADAEKICAAARKSDRIVLVGVNRRGDPTWRAAKEALASGQIGQVRQIVATGAADLRIFREDQPVAAPILAWLESSEMVKAFTLDVGNAASWRGDPERMGGDGFIDTGAHLVDVALWLGGAPPLEVSAFAPANRPRGAAIVTAQARLANDVVVSITFNDNVAFGDEFAFRGSGMLLAYGDGGTLTADIPGMGSGPTGEIVVERNGERHALPVEGEAITPAAAFVAAILDGAPNIAPVDEALNVVALVEAAYRSATEGRTVRIG